MFFFFSSRRRHTRCALVTGVQTCALPILSRNTLWVGAVDADADHRKSSDEEGWLHPLSLGFAGLLRGPAADSDASSEGRTRHGSNPFSTYSGPPRLGLARRCHAPTGNGSQTTGAAHADCRGGGRSEEHTSELQSLMR